MSSAKKAKPSGIRPLEVVKYGHPALRSKGRRIESIDDSIVKLAEEMIVTMYEEDGCGLYSLQWSKLGLLEIFFFRFCSRKYTFDLSKI